MNLHPRSLSASPLATVFSVLALSLLVAACSGKPKEVVPVRPVRLMTVSSGSGAQSVDLAGVVTARIESRMGFRVAGKILSRQVEVGQTVKRGDVLMRMDARDYQSSAQASTSAVAAAQAALDEARLDYKRYQTLFDKDVVTKMDIDKSRTHLASATADLANARSNASLQGYHVEDTILRADADGIVASLSADAGEVVSAGQPVLVLSRNGARDIEAAFPEDQLALAKAGQAQVRLWANREVWIPATLRELSAVADPVSRTFRARYALPETATGVSLGQSATLRLTVPGSTQAKVGVSLPGSALLQQSGRTMVWRYDPATGLVKRVPVTVIGIDGDDVRVVGLNAGTQVVTAGVHVLADAQKVRPMSPLPGVERGL